MRSPVRSVSRQPGTRRRWRARRRRCRAARRGDAADPQLTDKVAALERAEILAALRTARGVKARAAKQLGISRPTLDKKMADLGHRSVEPGRRWRRRAVNLLCPACHTPLPPASAAVVSCPGCSAEVDVTRAGTVAGKPRFVPEVDRTGTTVSGYRITARLAGGGMGTVYRATGSDGKPVAIKFLSPALAQNSEVVARFAREIAMLARLDHPAIVRVRAHGAAGRHPLVRDGSGRRDRPARAPRARPAAAAGDRRDLRAPAGGAGVRARCGRGPPRSQTGESLAGARRRAAGRLRRGALGRRGAGRQRRAHAAHRDRRGDRHAAVHVARAATRRRRRSPLGSVLDRRDALRGLDRRATAGRVPATVGAQSRLWSRRSIDWCCACCNRIRRAAPAPRTRRRCRSPRRCSRPRHACSVTPLAPPCWSRCLRASASVGARSGARPPPSPRRSRRRCRLRATRC